MPEREGVRLLARSDGAERRAAAKDDGDGAVAGFDAAAVVAEEGEGAVVVAGAREASDEGWTVGDGGGCGAPR